MSIEEYYNKVSTTYSDIYEHVPVHKRLAEECDSVVELGASSMISTWGFLMGLKPRGKYVGVNNSIPSEETYNTAKRLAEEKCISFNFITRDELKIKSEEIGECDMLFIDSIHTYCHVTYELETFGHLAKKYITGHDTSYPWDINDENDNDRSEYPSWYDRSKRGVLTAFQDFLTRHPEWSLKERKTNNHGFIILERTKSRVYGINFSIPAEKVVTEVPKKTRMESLLIPGKLDTYIYNTEEEYYKQYQESYFAITCKKGGWDCLRHYEIIANGCIPVFINIEQCPTNTLTLYPKELQKEANLFYSTYRYCDLDDEEFLEKYNILANKFLSYMRQNLTTIRTAEYILRKTGHLDKKKILFISVGSVDYLRCNVLHGFKSLLGKTCHDFPKVDHLYLKCDGTKNDYSELYGKGMSVTNLLTQDLHDTSVIYNTHRYYDTKEKITQHYFDLIIYGSMTRSLMLYNTVFSNYSPNEIIMLNGDDEQYFESKVPKTSHHIFVRELV